MATFARTIDSNYIYAQRADQDEDGNNIKSTYATKAEIPPGVTVDQTYDSTSTDAQSGTAVAEAVGAVDAVPTVGSGDNNKILTATYSNGSGSYDWAAAPTVDQTYNASSANAQSGLAVTGALANVKQVPSVGSSDNNKVLTASYDSMFGASYSWAAGPAVPTIGTVTL